MNKLVVFSVLAMSALSASAEYITPEQALGRLEQTSMPKSLRSREASKLKLVSSPSELYVFSSGDGFMILPADDIARPLLGYCENFDTVANPALAAWLLFYAREIEAARNAVPKAGVKASVASHASVAPLVKTKWNQGAPYCWLCPDDGTYYCVTGCVATAMAQVMKYHEWPAKGVGTHSYYWEGGQQTLSFDYGNTTFDWKNMLYEYVENEYSTDQAKAVATLMRAAGIAVDMDYSPEGSGASSYDVTRALVENFNYDKALYIAERDYYTAEEWDALIYGEIAAGRPVIYSGVTNNEAGHEFVVDGYSADGFYHLNWGWGGVSDGYFLLSALDPNEQGIGGSDSGYNYYQDAIIGMQLPVAGSKQAVMVRCFNPFYPEVTRSTLGASVNFSGGVFNVGYQSVTISCGIKYQSLKDNSETIIEWIYVPSEIPSLMGLKAIDFDIPANLADGWYYMTPVYKVDGEDEWIDLPVDQTAENVRYAEVSGNNIIFTDVAPEPDPEPETLKLEVSDLKLNSNFYWGKPCTVSFTVKNAMANTVYSGEVMPILTAADDDTPLAQGAYQEISLNPGENYSYNQEYSFEAIDGFNFTSGTYRLSVVDRETMTEICHAIIVNARCQSDVCVNVTNLLNTTDIQPGYSVATFEMTVTPTDGDIIDDYLQIVISKVVGDTTEDVLVGDTQTISLSQGNFAQLTATLDISGLEPGEYLAAPYFCNKRCGSGLNFTLPVAEQSSITELNAMTSDGEIYDLQGRRVVSPRRGLYLTPAGKLLIK